MTSPQLTAARIKRDKAVRKMAKIPERVQAEGRQTLTVEEARRFEELAVQIKDLDKTIAHYEEHDRRVAACNAAFVDAPSQTPAPVSSTPRAYIKSQPRTYDEYQPAVTYNSFFRDLAYVAAGRNDAGMSGVAAEARDRLAHHAKEVEVEARYDARIDAALRELRMTPPSLERRTNPNTTAGTGGEFVPPLWLVSQYVPFVRPTRTFANRVKNQALPPGVDIINVPKITVGSITAIQTANAAAVASQDIQTSTVSARVNTIAGQEDISLQLLEQSPLSMDNVIFDDLSRDYDLQLDTQVIAGSGTNGQHKGVLGVTGTTSPSPASSTLLSNFISAASTTFHDSSTTATQYRSIVNGVNQIETRRFDSRNMAIWVNPRRSNSWAYASDSTNRPLFIPARYGPFNVTGIGEGGIAQGVAGELFGLPVVKDPNMTTQVNGFTGSAVNLTGGTQDPVLVVKEDDLWLYEGTLRMRALPEILSGTLQIRFQVYAYSAFIPDRFPPSISVVAGAGMAAPGF